LVNINRNTQLVDILQEAYNKNKGGAKVFNALNFYSISTLTGRLRRNVNWTIHNNTSFSGLAADGAKLALWNLEYSDYKVVAFIHDEFIVEIEEDEDITLPLQIVCESMQDVIKNIPIRLEYSIADEWSKTDTLYDPE